MLNPGRIDHRIRGAGSAIGGFLTGLMQSFKHSKIAGWKHIKNRCRVFANRRQAHRVFMGYVLACMVFPILAIAADFHVIRGSAQLIDGEYILEAHIDYLFSDAALEALDNGVPLTIDLQLRVQRRSAWIWEPRVLDRHLRYMIRYHALAELYQVIDLNNDTQQNFVTRQAAIATLGEISAVSFLKKSDLTPGEKYRAKLKATLDIEALPLPLRPLAYLSPSWNLSSKWFKWPLPY